MIASGVCDLDMFSWPMHGFKSSGGSTSIEAMLPARDIDPSLSRESTDSSRHSISIHVVEAHKILQERRTTENSRRKAYDSGEYRLLNVVMKYGRGVDLAIKLMQK